MKHANLDAMVKGWFIGNFEPTLYRTNDVEVAVKRYKAGDCEQVHLHKIATEFTVIISGEVEMNGRVYHSGEIVVVEPDEATDFKVLSDVTTVVVKLPGTSHDKYAISGELLC